MEPERVNQSLRLRQTIETEIVDGRLAIGARLDETELAERFGVSRTPIREALLQLAMTGLVEIKPRRGAIVSAPDPQLLIAMFETMAEIEAACGRLAARRLVPADEADLKASLAACRVAAEDQDPELLYATGSSPSNKVGTQGDRGQTQTYGSPCFKGEKRDVCM